MTLQEQTSMPACSPPRQHDGPLSHDRPLDLMQQIFPSDRIVSDPKTMSDEDERGEHFALGAREGTGDQCADADHKGGIVIDGIASAAPCPGGGVLVSWTTSQAAGFEADEAVRVAALQRRARWRAALEEQRLQSDEHKGHADSNAPPDDRLEVEAAEAQGHKPSGSSTQVSRELAVAADEQQRRRQKFFQTQRLRLAQVRLRYVVIWPESRTQSCLCSSRSLSRPRSRSLFSLSRCHLGLPLSPPLVLPLFSPTLAPLPPSLSQVPARLQSRLTEIPQPLRYRVKIRVTRNGMSAHLTSRCLPACRRRRGSRGRRSSVERPKRSRGERGSSQQRRRVCRRRRRGWGRRKTCSIQLP